MSPTVSHLRQNVIAAPPAPIYQQQPHREEPAVAKKPYVIHEDGSVTFTEDVSDDVRKAAYEEAARQRASATNVDKEQAQQVEELARQSADLTATQRETGTEVHK